MNKSNKSPSLIHFANIFAIICKIEFHKMKGYFRSSPLKQYKSKENVRLHKLDYVLLMFNDHFAKGVLT